MRWEQAPRSVLGARRSLANRKRKKAKEKKQQLRGVEKTDQSRLYAIVGRDRLGIGVTIALPDGGIARTDTKGEGDKWVGKLGAASRIAGYPLKGEKKLGRGGRKKESTSLRLRPKRR